MARPSTSGWEAVQGRLARACTPRFQVGQVLGSGGMACVFLAVETRLGRRVAIKVMSPGLLTDSGLIARFQQEARTTAQLAHPNIVTIYDFDERDGLHFFVMEYVAGRTLGQVMSARASEPIPVDVVLSWVAQTASALTYAHRAGVVHRDIKPGNVLVDATGNARVTDFGIAKVADEPGLTRTGFLVGTPSYMSPEQCAGSTVTGSSDQYSLGVLAYELLAGRPPFTGPTMAVLQAHLTQEPPPLEAFRPDCPAPVRQAIARMLSKSPEERFPTAAAAAAAMGATAFGDEHPLRGLAVQLAVGGEPEPEFVPASAAPLPDEGEEHRHSPSPGVATAPAGDRTLADLSGMTTGLIRAVLSRRGWRAGIGSGGLAIVIVGIITVVMPGSRPDDGRPQGAPEAPPVPAIGASDSADGLATGDPSVAGAPPIARGDAEGAAALADGAGAVGDPVPAAAGDPVPATAEGPVPAADVGPPDPTGAGLGRIEISGTLPPGAVIMVLDEGGERLVQGGSATLAEGTYRLEATAPGYLSASAELEVVSGGVVSWTPMLQPAPVAVEAPPPAAPGVPAPAGGDPGADAAAVAQVQDIIDRFVRAIQERDMDAIVSAFPGAAGAWEQAWRAFLETPDVRDLEARLVRVSPIEVTGQAATATFVVGLSFADARQRQQTELPLEGRFSAISGGWTLEGLEQVR